MVKELVDFKTPNVLIQCAFDLISKEQNNYLSLLDLTKVYFFQTQKNPLSEKKLTIKKIMRLPKKNSQSVFYDILKFWKNKTKELNKDNDTHKSFFHVEKKMKSRSKNSPPAKKRKRKSKKKLLSIRKYSLEPLNRNPFKNDKKIQKKSKKTKMVRSSSFNKRLSKLVPRKSKSKNVWDKILENNKGVNFVFSQVTESRFTPSLIWRKQESDYWGFSLDG